jgi:TatD DNase family protein
LNGYFDTHCHLDLNAFDEDRSAVIQRAENAGVTFFVDPGIDIPQSQMVIELAKRHSGIFAAVGIHPESVTPTSHQDLVKLEALLPEDRVVAVGEIGLDAYHRDVPMEIQIPIFNDQLALAARWKLPVIIHSRETLEIIRPILLDWSASLPDLGMQPPFGVMHSFEGNTADAQAFVDSGWMIGLGGPVTYKNAAAKHDLAANLPLTALVLETDCPFLTPNPHRGTRNEPAFLPLIGQRTAIIRGCTEAEVREVTSANAQKLFRIGVPS